MATRPVLDGSVLCHTVRRCFRPVENRASGQPVRENLELFNSSRFRGSVRVCFPGRTSHRLPLDGGARAAHVSCWGEAGAPHDRRKQLSKAR